MMIGLIMALMVACILALIMMGKESHTWEATGGLATVDAFKDGVVTGGTKVKTFIVPDGKPHLWGIIPAGVSDGAGAKASTFLMRLKGSAKIRTTEIFLSAYGGTLATTHSTPLPIQPLTDLGIQVTPGSQLEVEFGMFGDDSGTAEAGATLIFSDREPKDGWFEYIALEILLTAPDEAGVLQLEGLGTAVAKQIAVPSDAIGAESIENGALDRIIAAVAADGSSTGAAITSLRLSESGIVFNQELIIGAGGGTHATEANGHVAPVFFKELEYDLRKSNTFTASALQWGADSGNVAVGCSFGIKVPQK